MNVSGTEIVGTADPMNMMIVVGILFGIGLVAAVGWGIYQLISGM